MIRWFVLFVLWCAPAAAAGIAGTAEAASAAEIVGADDPAFVAAKDRYLAGEVVPAVRALADLAPNNDAAALLLGQIDRTDLAPALRALPFRERRELLKAPRGNFGQSWLAAIADRSELAGALLGAGRDRPIEVARDLLDAGETSHAALAYLNAINFGAWDEILEDYDSGRLPENLRWLGWTAATFRTREAPPGPIGLKALTELDRATSPWAEFAFQGLPNAQARVPPPAELVNGFMLSGRPERHTLAFALVDDWMEDEPDFETHRALCGRFCADTQPACRRASYVATGGLMGTFGVASPVQNLIPQSEWARSPRAQGRLLDAAAANV